VSGVFVCLTTNPVKFSDAYAMMYIGLTLAIRRAGVTKMGIPRFIFLAEEIGQAVKLAIMCGDRHYFCCANGAVRVIRHDVMEGHRSMLKKLGDAG
jgi:hypothetical protein